MIEEREATMKRTIMVVEDDPATLQILTGILSLDNLEVVAMSEPEHAARVAATLGPDLFLLDLMLDGVSGIELAAELRDQGFEAPVIGISGSPFMREVAEETGLFTVLLEKPLDFDLLIERIEEAIEV